MGNLKISRGSAYADKLRSYSIFLDKKKIGEIKDGGVFEFECGLGLHSIHVGIGPYKTPELQFQAGDSQRIEFRCQNNVNPLLAIIYLFRPKSWIVLERVR